jgi:surfactin synthase thioesterase subunit
MRLASKGKLERRLFCFPYAGGGPTSFMKFAPYLDAGTELMLLQLPGRGDKNIFQAQPLINSTFEI